ncbi:patatin-like phospholipase family protein [Streptomyces marincola]|uniref:patatin-like phospholipase family protein n=1 Tax=Streptomyces marincola TaxID=2878388 RepID=UPI001CF5CF67|nr:patatin-like phospholipase family protein [Streptomyces marincola]UCM88816.1 patatin-like phospholipase family protein [Streptomyces marincola]
MADPEEITRTFGALADRATAAPHGARPRHAPAPRPAPPPPRAAALPRIGLVLAGGGAKGAYELGVCDYLAEMGMDVAAVSGTSIGALNGAVLAAEPDLRLGTRRLAAFWERFSTRSGVAPFADRGLRLDEAGLAAEGTARQLALFWPRLLGLRRRAGLLEELVNEAVDVPGIRAGRPLWVAAYPLKDMPAVPVRLRHLIEIVRWLGGAQGSVLRLNGLPEEQIRQAVLASAALPFIFPSRVVDGCAYLDGGLGGPGDRTPVRAFAEQEHCDVLVVVHLHPDAVVSPSSTARFLRIDIRPSVPIVPPGPLGPLSGMLAFSPERVRGLRVLGFEDARARFTETRRLLAARAGLADAEARMLAALARLGRGG